MAAVFELNLDEQDSGHVRTVQQILKVEGDVEEKLFPLPEPSGRRQGLPDTQHSASWTPAHVGLEVSAITSILYYTALISSQID